MNTARALSLSALVTFAQGALSEEHAEAHDLEHEPHHTIGVFVGNSTEDRRKDRRNGATLGLEYEYRYSQQFGVGLVADHVFGDLDVLVLAAPFAWHRGPWKLYGAPGIETGHGQSEPLIRVGVEYGFEAGGLEISPQVDLDFVDGEHVFVIGVVFATPF
jgi:hypothetical protein